MRIVSGLIELLRDVAVIAAVVGGALAIRHALALLMAHRRAAEQLAIEHSAGSSEAATRIETALGAIGHDIELLTAGREAGLRDAEMVKSMELRVHALLQSTGDPFLTFDEIRSALSARNAVLSAAPEPVSKSEAEPEQEPQSVPQASAVGQQVNADLLRRVLIGLVRDRVIAQLDRDRYFIASDFDTDDAGEA